MKTKHLLAFLFALLGLQGFSQKTLYWPTDFDNPASEFYQKISNTRRYESENFVLYWGDKVGNDPLNSLDASLSFNPRSIADTLEYSFKRYVTELKFCSNAPTTNLGKYKIITIIMGTWNSTDERLQAFAQASSFNNVIGAMFCHPNACKDGGALSHEFAHCLQMMQHIQENPGNGNAFAGYDWAGSFFETHANFMRAQAYPQWADIDGTLSRWIQTRHLLWSSMRHHYTSFHLMYYVQEKDGFDFTRRLWAESKNEEHPLETIKRLKGFTQEQLNDYLWGYAQRQPAFDYPIQTDSKIHADANFGKTIRSTHQYIKNVIPRYTSRQFTILSKVAGTAGQYYANSDWAPQDYGINIIPLYPTCTGTQKKVSVKFKGHTEVNNAQAGWRYGFVATKADGSISRYGAMSSAAEAEISFTFDTATEADLYIVVFSAPKTHVNYNMDEGYPKQRRYPYELSIANAVPEGYQPAADFRKWQKTSGKIHTNGGGWVANGSNVAATAYVGPYAMVLGGTVSGNARIEDWATVMGGTISGSAIVRGNACVYNATINTSAIVEGNAWMEGGSVTGTAKVQGNAMVWGAAYGNAVVVGGDAEIGSCSTNGVYLQPPFYRNGRTECDGKGAGDASNTDINAEFANFNAAQMAFSATPICGATVTYMLATKVVGSGTVTPASGTFDQGSVQSITATPAIGFAFSGWSGDAAGTANPLSITMDKNKSITATFTAIPTYTLSTTVVGSGRIAPAEGTFNQGTVQSITATPASGFFFAGWSGDATGTANPLSVTMDKNKSITATFKAIPVETLTYNITMAPQTGYTPMVVALDAAFIAKTLGLTAAQTASALGTTVIYSAIEPDGTLNATSTAIAPGHWFANTGAVITHGTGAYTYSELDLNKMMANVGQYPNTCKAGESVTMKQTLVYTKSATEKAQVIIVINLKISAAASTQTIALVQGWNLISTNVRPADSTIATVFKGLDVLEIKDINSYWRKGQADALNGLKTITAGNGYLVYMNTAGTLSIAGAQDLQGFKNLEGLNSGWNLIGCPYLVPRPFAQDFNAANCSEIKNFSGIWAPAGGTANSIEIIEPGKGYWLKK